MAKKTTKGYRLTKDLVIAAQAIRCPYRSEQNPIYARCESGSTPTNCNPRLCTWCLDFLKDCAKIAEEGIDNYI